MKLFIETQDTLIRWIITYRNKLIEMKLLFDMDAKGINYVHAKFQIHILKKQKKFKL